MGVKNSGTRSGFPIYSYLKTGVFTTIISLCSVFSVLVRGICYIIPHGIIHCLKSGGGFDCNRGGVWG